MKNVSRVFLFLAAIALVFTPLAIGAATATPPKIAATAAPPNQAIAPIAGMISTVTGIAISPLLGTAAYGAWQYLSAENAAARDALPWFTQMRFWLPALLIVAICAAKDAFGAFVPPGLKKPLDVLETFENKVSGLVAVGAVIPITVAGISKIILGSKAAAAGAMVMPSGLAMIPVGAIDFSWLLNLVTVPFAVAVFIVVWMGSHAINVLILLSPWGAIDAALKVARTSLLGLVTLSSTINPWFGAILSLIVILVAWFASGWAFRLTHFGSVFCWDFFTRRHSRFVPAENKNAMFAGGSLEGVPPRTYGRLSKTSTGGLEFVYRPWLLLPPQTAPVPAATSEISIGCGMFFSGITKGEDLTLFLLPPRYRGHEENVARAYGMRGTHDAGLRKAWSVVKELFGGTVAQAPAT